jgi:hypothetical protein
LTLPVGKKTLAGAACELLQYCAGISELPLFAEGKKLVRIQLLVIVFAYDTATYICETYVSMELYFATFMSSKNEC